MPGNKLPDGWDEDTRFDGPEHWGMDRRWKSLFPKSGVRLDDSDDSSSRESDSDPAKTKDIVDIDMTTDDDDDEDDGGLRTSSESEGDSHDATSLRIGLAHAARTRKKIPATAQAAPPFDQRNRDRDRVASSGRPTNSANTSTSSNSNSNRKARRDEANATARRWRQGNKLKHTEPAASSRVGRRVRPRPESGTPLRVTRDPFRFSSSEGEEEFDESEANITGHERSPALTITTTPTPRRRRTEGGGEEGGGRFGGPPASAERSGSSIRKEKTGRDRDRAERGKEGGRAASSPVICDDSSDASLGSSPYRGGEHDEIESSSGSESEDGGGVSSHMYASSAAGSSGNEGYRSGLGLGWNASGGGGGGGGGNRGSKDSRRRSLSSPSASSRAGDRGSGKHRPVYKKGTVIREGGRRDKKPTKNRYRSSSNQSKGASGKGTASSSAPAALAPGERHKGDGASKRLMQAGSKRARKVVHAQGDEHGWISKGGGGGGGAGGGGGGGARGRSNPVSSFQGSQAAVRKNQERSLTQSKLNFPVVLDD